MKKLLFLFLVLAAASAKAQTIKGSIDLKDSTINRTIPFEVATGTKSLKYVVKVYVDLGQVTVTLSDPNGRTPTNITIGGGHEASKGELSDDVKTKIPGTWKFNFRSDRATGKISYEIEIIKS
jgi:hypothetical protein